MIPSSPEETQRALEAHQYITDKGLSVAVFLALKLGRPLLLEGEPGVGKTEIVKVLAAMLGTRLIRLQCYEGLDINSAVYEWDYARQMLQIRLLEASGERDQASVRGEVFGSEYLLERPLLQALKTSDGKAPVLLIDELDRADEEFEAFLLEFLSDWQITIPEVGTIKAEKPPVVVITSNRTREIHDALKRRCLYFWIDYPSFEKEYRIVREKVPGVPEKLAQQVVSFVQELRKEDLYKAPGVAETLDWASSLMALDATALEPKTVEDTLGALLKYQDDLVRAKSVAQDLLARANLPAPM
jgi:MoxR-like ATPase